MFEVRTSILNTPTAGREAPKQTANLAAGIGLTQLLKSLEKPMSYRTDSYVVQENVVQSPIAGVGIATSPSARGRRIQDHCQNQKYYCQYEYMDYHISNQRSAQRAQFFCVTLRVSILSRSALFLRR